MRFLVVGCGSIGKRHIRNLIRLGVDQVIGMDVEPERLRQAQTEFGIAVAQDFTKALNSNSMDAVLVCTPPREHLSYAREVLQRGSPLFMEKPLAHSMEEVPSFLEEVAKHKVPVLVGFNFRFEPSLQQMKQLLDSGRIGRPLSLRAEYGQYRPDRRPGQDYRKNYSAQGEQGGGIVLDSIHELDYVSWLLGRVRELVCFLDRVSPLEMDAEDVAEILLRFENGAVGSIHMDCFRPAYHRSCEVVGTEGILQWSFEDQRVRLYTASRKEWEEFRRGQTHDVNEMYLKEMEHFLACLKGEAKPAVEAWEAAQILDLACAAKESSQTGRKVFLKSVMAMR